MTQELPRIPAKKRFLGKTVEGLVWLADRAGVTVNEAARAGHRSLEQRDHKTLAELIWELSFDLHGAALPVHVTHCTSIWEICAYQLREEAKVGDFVYVSGACIGNRQAQGIGQLMASTLDIHPKMKASYFYREDGGPRVRERKYHIRLLNGEDVVWGNAGIHKVFDYYLFSLYAKKKL